MVGLGVLEEELQPPLSGLELLGGRFADHNVLSAGDRCYGRRQFVLQVNDLSLEHESALARAIDRISKILELHLGVLNGLQVCRSLRRQLSAVPVPILLELLLVIQELPLRVLELRLEKLVR